MSAPLIALLDAKTLWYVTRATGVVSLVLLTASVVLGVTEAVRWASDRWPRFVTAGIHKNVSLLATTFIAVHIATAIVDGFAPIGWLDTVRAVSLRVPTDVARPRHGRLRPVGRHRADEPAPAPHRSPRLARRALGRVRAVGRSLWSTGSARGPTPPRRRSSVSSSFAWLPSCSRCGGASPPDGRIASDSASSSQPPARWRHWRSRVWAFAGPLQPGWARRAGTPASLLGGTPSAADGRRRPAERAIASGPPPMAPAPSGLTTPFDASVDGTVTDPGPDRRGNETITIDATLERRRDRLAAGRPERTGHRGRRRLARIEHRDPHRRREVRLVHRLGHRVTGRGRRRGAAVTEWLGTVARASARHRRQHGDGHGPRRAPMSDRPDWTSNR